MFSDLTILVIHYRTPQLLSSCLEKLTAFAVGARVVVLDSSPADEIPTVDTELVRVPNYSFAHTVNCGLKLAQTPYTAHLNADVFISAETFPALLRAITRPNVGMVGPRARTQAGRFQDQGLPYRLHYARLDHARPNHPRPNHDRSGGTRRSVPVPWLSGCLQLVRAEAVAAVGGLDASLRFYNEDMEWCYRLRRAAWRCELVATDVLHLGGSSTPRDPRFLVEGYRGGYKLSQRYHGRNYQALHRGAVKLESAWHARFASTPERREAARQIQALFASGQFDESPFGETLTNTNPAFSASVAAR